MAKKTIERKFGSRYDGVTQFVTNYGDFENLKIGHWPIFLFEDSNKMEFQAFFEGRELIEVRRNEKQKVFLQYDVKKNIGGLKSSEIKVGEYNFPLSGKIKQEDLKKYFVKYHSVNQ